jgi:hypothetical protein
MQQEAIELRLGQRIGAGLLDRILRGQHEERLRQRAGHAGMADGALGHRFEQRGLGLGRRAVELVGQQQLGEHRPLLEAEVPSPGAVVFFEQFGAQQVAGHQVGRELHAAEVEVERLAERAHQQRLAQPRHPFEQHVPAGKQRDQQLLDDLGLADDGARDRSAQCIELRQTRLQIGLGGDDGGHATDPAEAGVMRSVRTSRC